MTKYEISQCKKLGFRVKESNSIAEFYNVASEEIKSAMRLGAKMGKEDKIEKVSKISSPADAYNIFKERIDLISGEESLWVMLLNNANRLLDVVDVSSKNMPAGSELNLRKLLKLVLFKNAAGVIFAHNHPSGNLHSSTEDERITIAITDILKQIGVTMLDHLIVTEEGFSKIDF